MLNTLQLHNNQNLKEKGNVWIIFCSRKHICFRLNFILTWIIAIETKLHQYIFQLYTNKHQVLSYRVTSTSCMWDTIETQISPPLVDFHQKPRSGVNNLEMTITSSPTTVTVLQGRLAFFLYTNSAPNAWDPIFLCLCTCNLVTHTRIIVSLLHFSCKNYETHYRI